MKRQYHITIKEDYFRQISPDWPALSQESKKEVKRKIFAGIEAGLQQGRHIFTTSDHVSIRAIDRPRFRVIRSMPATFK